MYVWSFNTWSNYRRQPLELFRDIYRNLKRAWQRATRGWSEDWCWSMNYVLSEIIPEMIVEIKKYGIAYPALLDVPDDELEKMDIRARVFWGSNQGLVHPDDPDQEPVQRWHAILHEIAEGFRAANRMVEGMFLFDELEAEWEKRYPDEEHRGFDANGQFFTDPRYDELKKELRITEREAEIFESEMEKFNKGMMLFKRYYFDLWD
jgi:hypothetical protein